MNFHETIFSVEPSSRSSSPSSKSGSWEFSLVSDLEQYLDQRSYILLLLEFEALLLYLMKLNLHHQEVQI